MNEQLNIEKTSGGRLVWKMTQTLEEAQIKAQQEAANVMGTTIPVMIFRQGKRTHLTGAVPMGFIADKILVQGAKKRSRLAAAKSALNRPEDPSHTAVIAKYLFDNYREKYILPPLTLNLRQRVSLYVPDYNAEIKPGYLCGSADSSVGGYGRRAGSSGMKELDLYSFAYRGVLTEEALDRVGRRRRSHFGAEEARQAQRSRSYDFLDSDLLNESQRMSIVYAAIHAFENTVRLMVTKAMAETHGEIWWEKIPERIRKTSKIRMEEDAKFRWHGARGAAQINYCDFSDLSSIIVTNWPVFDVLLGNMEWAKATLNTLEKSRNIVMHGGSLSKEDVERIGMNIRDWIRQAG